MNFRIADTFTDSLARLTGDEQKAVNTTAFDLQLNPANPGLKFHKLDRARDRRFWSVRVNVDIRLIVHRMPGSLLLCYVDHHDRAYDWAARRKLETHPATGAAQIVEIRETVQEILVPRYASPSRAWTPPPRRQPFAALSDEELLGYGVPPDWLADVRSADEDSLLTLAEHLPAEAAEGLLEFAVGGRPRQPVVQRGDDPFAHPDAQRRFRVMKNVAELQRAFDYPWDKWTVFLHPEQRQWVERDFSGPARVSGSAGTGKTIVAIHRAAHLARAHPDAKVLLTTFSDTLAHALRANLLRLVSGEGDLAERIEVASLDAVGHRFALDHSIPATILPCDDLRELIRNASAAVPGHRFGLPFLLAEWEQVVDAWQLDSWEAYREVPRLGRKTRLPEAQRRLLWSIYERVRAEVQAAARTTRAEMFTRLAGALSGQEPPSYRFVIVDEAQDISVAQLRFCAALGGDRPNALFFAGDLGQRIFQQMFSWKALGVDVRGRSRTLRVNYRTSHQIRSQADRLLGPEASDADGNTEERGDTVSVFNGPSPRIESFSTEAAEIQAVADWLAEQTRAGVVPQEIALFVRSPKQLDRARNAAQAAGLSINVLDDRVSIEAGQVSLSTMHLAKGLEFRAVAVMACDDEVIPLQERIEAIGDDADLKEIYDTERHLLYVACTRARDHLLVTSVEPRSEFLDDLRI